VWTNVAQKEKSLPIHLQERLRDFFRFKRFNSDSGSHAHLLSNMSPKLRGEVSIHMHSQWMKRMPIFQDAPREFFTEMCLVIKTSVFSVRELIIREGEPNMNMHIIECGLVVSRGKFFSKCVPPHTDSVHKRDHRAPLPPPVPKHKSALRVMPPSLLSGRSTGARRWVRICCMRNVSGFTWPSPS
jgi:hypothetical protein